jgi:spermidine synthase
MKKFYILTLAFFSGMCVMAIELSASRLMAPYFGSSTFIWTNIIGVIMVALSLGYYFGGKLADKNPNISVLCKWIIIACVFLLFVPTMTHPLIKNVITEAFQFASGTTFIFLGSFLSVVILFAFPIMLLGMTSPFLITVLSKDNRVGDASGKVFSISTIGSIIGTFLPVLIFVPFIGTAKTILFFSTLLFIIATIGFFNKKAWLLLLILIVPWFIGLQKVKAEEGVIYQTESSYQFIKVVEVPDAFWLQYDQSNGVQSVLKKKNILSGMYYDNFSLVPYLQNNTTKNMAILGLAGGIIGKQIHYFHPEIEVDGVEIDQKVIDISREYFGLEPSINVHNKDGRIFLQQSDQKYDLIVVDTFANELYIPFHLTTKEFFAEVKAHLTDQGVMGMNILVSSPDAEMMKSMINTLKVNFAHVYALEVHQGGFNYLLLASEKELDFDLLSQGVEPMLQGDATYFKDNIKEMSYSDDTMILTDDKAPIEFMTDWMIINYIY